MRLVVDSSVALKWFLKEPDSAIALALRDGYIRQVHEFLAPDVFPVEIAHALSRAERRLLIAPPMGAEFLADLSAILPPLHSSLPLLPRAFEISSAARIGVYDCLYVALAEREQCDFVTADRKLISNIGGDFPFIVALESIRP